VVVSEVMVMPEACVRGLATWLHAACSAPPGPAISVQGWVPSSGGWRPREGTTL
jgi:hypothetical protein